MKVVKKILPIFAVIFFCLIIFFSFILLNRNKFGIFEMGDKLYVNISNNNSSKTYKKGSIVILKKINLKEIKKNDEVFLYKQNPKTKEVQLISSKIKLVDVERSAVVASYDGKYYTEDFIAGKPDSSIPFWGGFFNLVLSKWFFLLFILIPAFAIVVYEIYLLFISIKYDDDEELNDENKNEDSNNNKQITTENVDNNTTDSNVNNSNVEDNQTNSQETNVVVENKEEVPPVNQETSVQVDNNEEIPMVEENNTTDSNVDNSNVPENQTNNQETNIVVENKEEVPPVNQEITTEENNNVSIPTEQIKEDVQIEEVQEPIENNNVVNVDVEVLDGINKTLESTTKETEVLTDKQSTENKENVESVEDLEKKN